MNIIFGKSYSQFFFFSPSVELESEKLSSAVAYMIDTQ